MSQKEFSILVENFFSFPSCDIHAIAWRVNKRKNAGEINTEKKKSREREEQKPIIPLSV